MTTQPLDDTLLKEFAGRLRVGSRFQIIWRWRNDPDELFNWLGEVLEVHPEVRVRYEGDDADEPAYRFPPKYEGGHVGEVLDLKLKRSSKGMMASPGQPRPAEAPRTTPETNPDVDAVVEELLSRVGPRALVEDFDVDQMAEDPAEWGHLGSKLFEAGLHYDREARLDAPVTGA